MFSKFFLILLLIQHIRRCISEADCPTFVNRHTWASKPALSADYILVPVKYVVVSHTVTPECNSLSECSELVESIRVTHMEGRNRWNDIGFNFLIGGDGRVYIGAGWHREGAHTYGYNRISLGIAFIGNFGDKLPNEKSLTAAKKLLSCGVKKGELSSRYSLIGQRQVSSTASPGVTLYQEIQTWKHWTPNP